MLIHNTHIGLGGYELRQRGLLRRSGGGGYLATEWH